MLRVVEGSARASSSVTEAFVVNYLSLSAFDGNKLVIGASDAIPFLVRALRGEGGPSSEQARQDALRALYNLSIAAANSPRLVAAGAVPVLLEAVGDVSTADRAPAALANVVAASADGHRAVSREPDGIPTLVDVIDWSDAPGCQEKAAYVLMVLARRSRADRAAIAEAGAASALLELALVGTPLAQKRAARILEILHAYKRVVAEGPGHGGASFLVASILSAPLEISGGGEAGMCAERPAVRRLAQQSLQSNMRRIAQRARLPPDLAPATAVSVRALTASSTSKSLPF